MSIIKKIIYRIPGVCELRRKYKLKKRSIAIKHRGLVELEILYDEFNKVGACVFADYGTLLGIVRNGRLISWDNDIDMGVIFNDKFGWNELEMIMTKLGYTKNYYFELDGHVTEQNYSKENVVVDFFEHKNENESSIAYVYDKYSDVIYPSEDAWSIMEFKTNAISGIEEAICEGHRCAIPVDAEDYLALVYGKEWRMPNPKWKTGDGPATSKIKNRYSYMINNFK